MKNLFKKNAKQFLFILAGLLIATFSVQAATIIGDSIQTSGLNILSQDDSETELRVDGTLGTTSSALIKAMGETSRLMFISGESTYPTTWSLGINTELSADPNQDFQIRQISDGEGVVDKARMTILKSNGNIGIGTTTPQSDLHIYGNNVNSHVLIDSNNPMLRFSNQLSDPNNKNWALYAHQNSFIGSTNPDSWSGGSDSWLHVNRDPENNKYVGSVNFPNGNIGIGTTTPLSKLDVNGDINIASSSSYKINGVSVLKNDYLSNLFLGKNAGHSADLLTSGSNTFIGDSSGYSCALSGCSGNTFLGAGTGYSIESGQSNIFLGYNSGRNNIDGNNNIFIGNASGHGNINGYRNIFIGHTAGYNETGSNKLYISNNISVEEDPLIYGEFDNEILGFNASVGIGTTTPESNLHVYGGETATSTIQVGGESGNGACLKLRDSDGQGWTYCTTLNGILNCSTAPCN